MLLLHCDTHVVLGVTGVLSWGYLQVKTMPNKTLRLDLIWTCIACVLWLPPIRQFHPFPATTRCCVGVTLPFNVFRLLLGDPEGIPKPDEIYHHSTFSLVLPRGLLPVGHALKNLQRKGNSSPEGILIRCPNHLDWLVLTQRSSSSNAELPPDVSATYPISTGAARSCFWLTGSWMFALTLFSAAVSCVYQGDWFSVDQTETRKQSQDLFAFSAQLHIRLQCETLSCDFSCASSLINQNCPFSAANFKSQAFRNWEKENSFWLFSLPPSSLQLLDKVQIFGFLQWFQSSRSFIM